MATRLPMNAIRFSYELLSLQSMSMFNDMTHITHAPPCPKTARHDQIRLRLRCTRVPQLLQNVQEGRSRGWTPCTWRLPIAPKDAFSGRPSDFENNQLKPCQARLNKRITNKLYVKHTASFSASTLPPASERRPLSFPNWDAGGPETDVEAIKLAVLSTATPSRD